MNVFVRFLQFWAGVDFALLRRCPRHERSKYTSSGALVLLTGTSAFAASSYAFFTVFERPETAIACGFLWALIILNLDRLLLATFPKCDPWYRQFLHAMPRLVLATGVGLTIAHPIVIRVFQPEIIEHIKGEIETKRRESETRRDTAREHALRESMQAKQGLTEYATVEQRQRERDDLSTQLSRCEALAAGRQLDVMAEADGTGGSHRIGCGSICREKKGLFAGQLQRCADLRGAIDRAKGALELAEQRLSPVAARVDTQLEERDKKIEGAYTHEISNADSAKSLSFFARSEALDVMARRPSVAVTRLFVSAFPRYGGGHRNLHQDHYTDRLS
jgi:hypothetical protein